MDFARPSIARERRRRRVFYGVVGVSLLCALTLGLRRLQPAPPTVEWNSILVGSVKRGPMLRQVRASSATLVPEEIRWIPALSEGRVERIIVRPGTAVKADTTLVVLSNPQVEEALLEAQAQLRSAEADLTSLQVQLQSQVLDLRANAAKSQADYEQAQTAAETNAKLGEYGVASALTVKNSQTVAQELKVRAEIDEQRYQNGGRELEARVAAQRAKVDQARALYRLALARQDGLRVRAGADGILQELSLNSLPLQVGQPVQAGTTIAKVANPKRLMAELKIPETQAKDVQLNQPAEIDTHNGMVSGKVTRLDPSVQDGTRTVDVTLTSDLPPGSVPDLSVDGTIDLERLENVLYIGHAAFGAESASSVMFRVEPGEKAATRVQVKLGRASANAVEVLGGLQEGDKVILSDMSRWAEFDRVRLER